MCSYVQYCLTFLSTFPSGIGKEMSKNDSTVSVTFIIMQIENQIFINNQIMINLHQGIHGIL